MKITQKLLSALLALLLTLSLTACQRDSGGGVNIPLAPTTPTASDDFQKNMHQSKYTYILDMCETAEGAYFNRNGLLYYLDKADKRVTVLCGKPDCDHSTADCNARINSRGMWYSGGRLYCVSYARGNGGKFVTSIDPAGTDRRNVQELQYEANGVQSSVTGGIYYGGDVYYVRNDVLYRVPLGGDKKDAQAIWGQETAGTDSGVINLTGDELRFTLWADGDSVYFTVNLEQPDGTYKDTLFAYSTATGDVRPVWQTPDRSEAGEWDTAGVSVTSWYVLDGYIYYYLAGNGLWRSSLPDGKPQLLADTSAAADYGTALFSDDFMCLLNDAPGFGENQGGDTVLVYTLDGTLQKQLPLSALLNETENITGFAPLFISGSEYYFIADAGVWGDVVNGQRYEDKEDILCCLDLETGDITRIYTWD